VHLLGLRCDAPPLRSTDSAIQTKWHAKMPLFLSYFALQRFVCLWRSSQLQRLRLSGHAVCLAALVAASFGMRVGTNTGAPLVPVHALQTVALPPCVVVHARTTTQWHTGDGAAGPPPLLPTRVQ